MEKATLPFDRRFWARVAKGSENECWNWTGAVTNHGYPALRIGVDSRTASARRYAYEQVRGVVDVEPDQDWIFRGSCRNRRCVNPAHTEPTLRGATKTNRTHCPRGHEFTQANTFIEADGSRRCKRCRADRSLLRWRGDPSVRQRRKERYQDPDVRKRVRERTNKYVRTDPVRALAYQRKIKARRREWLAELKTARGCCRCGETHPGCLEFHHKGSKGFAISTAFRAGLSREKILIEVAGCDVICANCHRKHHWDERQKYHAARNVRVETG